MSPLSYLGLFLLVSTCRGSSHRQLVKHATAHRDAKQQACEISPCLNGGTCVETATDSYKCKCTPYFIGSNCAIEVRKNVALSTCGAVCDESSKEFESYDCYSSIDGSYSSPSWTSDYEQAGAWMRVNFTDYFRINALSIFDLCQPDRESSSLTIDTSDYKSQPVSLMCRSGGGCNNKFWQQFYLTPTITSFVNLDMGEMCNPNSTDVNGLHGVRVYGNHAALMNAALTANGASCTASSELSALYSCMDAIDGVDEPGPQNEWLSQEGAGAWIQIDLDQGRTVMAVGFLQRCSQSSQNRGLTLEFSDRTSQQLLLECFSGADPLDCDGQYWQQFDLNPYVVTSYVRVTISTVCSTENNGFREIRVFSLKSESNY